MCPAICVLRKSHEWAKTAMATKSRRVGRPTSHLGHSCIPASGWMWTRALDSRCGENDGSRGQRGLSIPATARVAVGVNNN